jgi:hypothetical protein
MIISLITGSSIHQKGLGVVIDCKALISSKTHRIYRFLELVLGIIARKTSIYCSVQQDFRTSMTKIN